MDRITNMGTEIQHRLTQFMSKYEDQLKAPDLQDGSTYAEYTSGVLRAKVIALSTAVHVVGEVMDEFRSNPSGRV